MARKFIQRYGPWMEKYLKDRSGEWFTSTQLNDYLPAIFPGMHNYIGFPQLVALLMCLTRRGVLKMEKRWPRGHAFKHPIYFWQYP